MKKILLTPTGSFLVRIRKKAIFLFVLILFPGCLYPGLLSLGVGSFDTLRPNERMIQFQAEYKWDACWRGVQPFAGAMLTKKGSLYICFGAAYDIYLGRHLVLTPSFAPGVYFKNGGKELGLPLEFRSSLALAVEFGQCHRLGVQFYHISNGSLGFKNPGEESLVVFYSMALF
ncbi:MAG: acyloxyacyl hydrolase [Verrucomicrobia bacterium]|nr:acyloxyacyl hydrolase [Verrucomicrobiota bacterium]